MSKITIELVSEQIDDIVIKELRDYLKSIKQDIKNAKKGIGYHHPEDVERYPKDKEAIERVLSMYEVAGK